MPVEFENVKKCLCTVLDSTIMYCTEFDCFVKCFIWTNGLQSYFTVVQNAFLQCSRIAQIIGRISKKLNEYLAPKFMKTLWKLFRKWTVFINPLIRKQRGRTFFIVNLFGNHFCCDRLRKFWYSSGVSA